MKTLTIFLFILLCTTSCKKDDIEPNQQILGKWEVFYLGNGEYRPPIQNPTGYQHFLPDSVLLEYDYATKITYTKKYWIDSLLHTAIQREDGRWLTFDFDCQFKGDTMRLERKNVSAIFNVSKHKRIN